jgi:serine/threonine protein kinase/dipeptidyl aminopeptidase/acylaminoacyl peptidase
MQTPERWQEVKEILYAALEMSAADRSSFLDEKCGRDNELRQEIESLIAAHIKAAERFESPAVEMMADVVSDQETDGMIGRSLGHYQIIEKIGAGGMGEVYLARDNRLDRRVALKFLPSYFTQDGERLRRFQQEARAASALNHPNILTIHEVGQFDSTHYIATEYVEGESLRDHINRGPSKITDALAIASQVAGALATAHQAGIVHRDVKPENIMLRQDGIVKVVDFGLAKLTARRVNESEASTVVNTDDGIVIGTAQYMSPEQARGAKVDARTDIWSLGCVLYEMLTGRSPFAQPTPGDVIVCILERDPPPLARYAGDIPREQQRIITKTLAKDREKRYQSVKDLLIDLKNLRDELEFEAKLEHSAQPVGGSNISTRRQGAVDDTHEPATRTTELIAPQPTSSAEYIVRQFQLHRKRIGVAAVAALAILAAVSFGAVRLYQFYWQSEPSKQPAPSLQTMKITRLTTTGRASQAAISPDGKYVVHVSSQAGQQHLRVRQVNTNSDVQIVPPADVRYTGLTFSRDGDFIYYVVSDKNNPQTTLHQVPVLGGTPRKVISNVGSAVTFSPDGKRFAFIRQFIEQGEEGVMVANADGSGEQTIAVRKFPNFFRSVSWSPDGKTIACGAGSHVPVYNSYVVLVPVEGGPEKPIPSQGWTFMGQIEWLQDGSGLILAASEQASASFDSSQVWFLSRQGGDVRRITNDLNNYSGVSLTADSSRLVTVQSETVSNIWLIPSGDVGRASQITQGVGKRDGKDGTIWMPDGRIIYVSKESGNDDIWIMNADGSGQIQLTSGAGINSNPSVSPDGRFIIFTSTRDGAPHIWRTDIDGANAKQLTSGSGEDDAQFSSDGKWVVYTLFAGKPTLWRVSIEGGAPSPISEKTLSAPAVSPDGRMIASVYWDEELNSPARIAVVPFEGGEIMKTFALPEAAWGNLRWTHDGTALTYVITTAGVSNIWRQPLAGGEPKQLTDFKADQIFSFDWSRDGKQIVSSRGVETNDVVLVSNFR